MTESDVALETNIEILNKIDYYNLPQQFLFWMKPKSRFYLYKVAPNFIRIKYLSKKLLSCEGVVLSYYISRLKDE